MRKLISNIKNKVYGYDHTTTLKVALIAFFALPGLAEASIWDTLQEQASNIRTGLYAVGGTIAVITLVWSGVKWALARSNGDHSYTFKDYIEQGGVILVIGGSMVTAAAIWAIFGSGNPNS